MRVAPDDSRRRLLSGVRGRRQEIGHAVLGRVHAIGPGGSTDLEYRDGLRLATEAAIDYTIEALEGKTDPALSLPAALLSQARLAAQRRVPLEVMLRRYLAGHAMVGDFVIEEAERLGISPGVLRPVLRSQAAKTDQAVALLGAAYLQEAASIRPRSHGQRRAELVGRLLDGELLDPAALDYDLDLHHVAAIVRGDQAADTARALRATLTYRMLIVAADDTTTWIWLGSHRELPIGEIERQLSSAIASGQVVALGEPAQGVDGWRLSHRQALATLPIACRRGSVVRYQDVALFASIWEDQLLVSWLRRRYLTPLGGELHSTLGAYFRAEGNVSSAAAALGLDRHTVTRRIRLAEERIGKPLHECALDIQMALGLVNVE